jgi:hypothetical protein
VIITNRQVGGEKQPSTRSINHLYIILKASSMSLDGKQRVSEYQWVWKRGKNVCWAFLPLCNSQTLPVGAATSFRVRNPFIIMSQPLTWAPINTHIARYKSLGTYIVKTNIKGTKEFYNVVLCIHRHEEPHPPSKNDCIFKQFIESINTNCFTWRNKRLSECVRENFWRTKLLFPEKV